MVTSLKRRLHPLVAYFEFEKPLRGCWSLKSLSGLLSLTNCL